MEKTELITTLLLDIFLVCRLCFFIHPGLGVCAGEGGGGLVGVVGSGGMAGEVGRRGVVVWREIWLVVYSRFERGEDRA
nr:hypothetical protein [Tanacetum cinerariifolium]